VARDRKRAKQRQQRRGRDRGSDAPASQPVRSDLPGALDHASADVDEFDAAIVRGAGGVPVSPDDAVEEESPQTPEDAPVADGTGSHTEHADADDDDSEALAAFSAEPSQAPGAPLHDGNRVLSFLRASWAELQRVQWPDRPYVFQATAVVLGFVAIAGAYLGAADFVAKEIVEFILG
jgi:preprotein translocase SecE subunit